MPGIKTPARYSATLLQHFRRPRRAGKLPVGQRAGSGSAGSVAERALLNIDLAVVGGQITDSRFQAYGGGAVIACGSWVADWAVGKTLDQARRLDSAEVAAALALPALDIRAAVLAEQALAAAVEDYQSQS